MGFLLLGLSFWGMVGGSLILFLVGLIKRSSKALNIAGILFLLPSLVLGSREGWMGMVVVMPWLSFFLAYASRKKVTQTSIFIL